MSPVWEMMCKRNSCFLLNTAEHIVQENVCKRTRKQNEEHQDKTLTLHNPNIYNMQLCVKLKGALHLKVYTSQLRWIKYVCTMIH